MWETLILSDSGRLTLPADVRRALGLEGETRLEVAVDNVGEAIIPRPAVALRRDDAWAYTPRHRSLLARAHADSREDRVREMSEDKLKLLDA